MERREMAALMADLAEPPYSTPDGWILLHGARVSGRRLFVRVSDLLCFERDPAPERDGTLVRIRHSDYIHVVTETPEAIFDLMAAAVR